MNYKLILLLLVALFIGANLLCSCCRYPVFDYLMGRSKEGLKLDSKDVGTPGSIASVKKAESDKAAVISSGQPLPPVVTASTSISPATENKESMTLMGSDINEVQNCDIAGMWVTKANNYASEFGYGIINNTGSAYTADEPLKNGEMVLFAKNKFKPECCPAPYSSSTGCVCMTPEQINFLNTRGGNRTSDSGV